MAAVEFLPREFGYVVLVLYSFLNFWMTFQVGKARKKYKVFYPTLYALESENKDAKLFNCVQRGHQNSLEMMPMFFAMLVLGGLHRPLIAATRKRVFYFGEKKNTEKYIRDRLSLSAIFATPATGLCI
ncbi:hypothetical protein HHK36_028193 [Tetracentron sinense]|uniref:Microsomal glutathione S-transferase 3 n=1 Tax=Tetracentron sinense TaxID=13715 RepID=A0A834YFD5_TETSI|nr:hypothetical protein HHK36_033162 [Tetracentron sinense]KAF8380703.1 hypothetical protein HHK36_028193 [Tetracentron sinense]